MGSVELAVREVRSFKRLYAVKRLKPAFRDDESLLRMFLDEARIAGSIRHPNVVSVLDVVDSDDEGPLLVMEYIDGVTLSALIRRCLKTNRPLPLQIVVRIGAQVADGLHAAHVLRDMDGREMRVAVSYTHLRAHETGAYLVCRLLLEKKKYPCPYSGIRLPRK